MFKNLKNSISLIAAFLMLGSLSVKADITVASAGPMSGQYASFGLSLKLVLKCGLKIQSKRWN